MKYSGGQTRIAPTAPQIAHYVIRSLCQTLAPKLMPVDSHGERGPDATRGGSATEGPASHNEAVCPNRYCAGREGGEMTNVLVAGYVPAGFRLLGISTLRQCMKVDAKANCCGIYFLWKGDDLAYIGSSLNVKVRVAQHARSKKIGFTKARYLPIPFPWHLSVEAAYIDRYMPLGNIRHKPTGISQEVINEMLAKRAISDARRSK